MGGFLHRFRTPLWITCGRARSGGAALARGVHRLTGMPDPFWLIVGFIAIACVLLFPLRLWVLSRRRGRDEEPGGDPVPLAPPERRNRG